VLEDELLDDVLLDVLLGAVAVLGTLLCDCGVRAGASMFRSGVLEGELLDGCLKL
jgi:hypothetical protein